MNGTETFKAPHATRSNGRQFLSLGTDVFSSVAAVDAYAFCEFCRKAGDSTDGTFHFFGMRCYFIVSGGDLRMLVDLWFWNGISSFDRGCVASQNKQGPLRHYLFFASNRWLV
eukprot:gnl/TRDRNA2_/TRDRNA2_153942_c1_seq1.p1 gnl/TRDRNA2_/TRDRNA2_153942_c1~~gnl/TRDRNA2_/TRDRNA2_153942_c1_seq1.p1  ORF type:complete len:127 (+),score=12.40 gnl/TRDRNA2_/TRDRNA2_153942_c1_seq1:43-381(+)